MYLDEMWDIIVWFAKEHGEDVVRFAFLLWILPFVDFVAIGCCNLFVSLLPLKKKKDGQEYYHTRCDSVDILTCESTLVDFVTPKEKRCDSSSVLEHLETAISDKIRNFALRFVQLTY